MTGTYLAARDQVKGEDQDECYQGCGCLSVPYVKFLPEELVVVSHAAVHFFLQLVHRKWWVLPVCAR